LLQDFNHKYCGLRDKQRGLLQKRCHVRVQKGLDQVSEDQVPFESIEKGLSSKWVFLQNRGCPWILPCPHPWAR